MLICLKTYLELSIDGYRDISLIGVDVDFKECGKGTIINQRIDQYFKVTVRFPNIEKSFNVHKKFSGRPRFENDEEIVEALSCLADTMKEIERLKKEKARLERA